MSVVWQLLINLINVCRLKKCVLRFDCCAQRLKRVKRINRWLNEEKKVTTNLLDAETIAEIKKGDTGTIGSLTMCQLFTEFRR